MRDTIWYVEARKSANSEPLGSTAVAIWLQSAESASDPGSRYLLTCAHAIRDTAANGDVGYGPVLDDIRVWKPDSGCNPKSALIAKISDKVKFSREEVPVADREAFANDWVLTIRGLAMFRQ